MEKLCKDKLNGEISSGVCVIEKGNFIDKLIGSVLLGYGLANGVKQMLSRPLLGPWPPCCFFEEENLNGPSLTVTLHP
jgi:hypothetical protein